MERKLCNRVFDVQFEFFQCDLSVALSLQSGAKFYNGQRPFNNKTNTRR